MMGSAEEAELERGSDKHSPMVDEALKHDTASLWHGGPAEARSEEFREQEGPAEGEPTPDARLRGGGEIPGYGLYISFFDTESNRVSMMQPTTM